MTTSAEPSGSGASPPSPKADVRLPLEDRKAQSAVMLMRRLSGDITIKDLAAEMGLSERTVRRRLELAREDDSVASLTRKVFAEDLLPLSINVLRKALMGDDLRLAVQVACKVVDALKVLNGPIPTDSNSETSGAETLDVFRAKFTRRPARTAADAAGYASTGTIDVSSAQHEDAPIDASADALSDEAANPTAPPAAGPSAPPSVPFSTSPDPEPSGLPSSPAQDSPGDSQ